MPHNMKIEEIINELLDNNIEITMKKSGDNIRYHLPGFYKSSGSVYLVEENGHVYCYQRYDKKTPIGDMIDVLYVNRLWWNITKERNPGYIIEIDEEWKELLVKHGVVKEETKTITTYS
jgi:hypothetical protein